MNVRSTLRIGFISCFMLGISISGLAESDLEKASRLIKEKSYQEAQVLLDRTVRTDPRNAEAWYQMGELQFALHYPQKAVDSADRAIKINPGKASYHLLRGRAMGNLAQNANMFRALGLASDALESMEKAVQLEPRNRDAVLALFNFYFSVPSLAGGSEEKALALAERTVGLEPATGHYLMGLIRQKQKNLGAALAEYRMAIAADPRFATAYNALAYVEVQMKQLDMALSHFRKLVELEPGNGDWYDSLGDGWMAKGNLGEAINAYRKALTLNPGLLVSMRSLGKALEQAGRREEAIQHYRQCAQFGLQNGMPAVTRQSNERLKALGVKE